MVGSYLANLDHSLYADIPLAEGPRTFPPAPRHTYH